MSDASQMSGTSISPPAINTCFYSSNCRFGCDNKGSGWCNASIINYNTPSCGLLDDPAIRKSTISLARSSDSLTDSRQYSHVCCSPGKETLNEKKLLYLSS